LSSGDFDGAGCRWCAGSFEFTIDDTTIAASCRYGVECLLPASSAASSGVSSRLDLNSLRLLQTRTSSKPSLRATISHSPGFINAMARLYDWHDPIVNSGRIEA
jgi:hypothetical protein